MALEQVRRPREVLPRQREPGLRQLDVGSVRCSAASYGRGSIKKRRSPFWTIAPSWKWIDCRYPLTRGRTSTESTASRRAVNSSHSVISRATGWTTFTFGGGGAGAGRALHEARTSAQATGAHLDMVRSPFRIPVTMSFGRGARPRRLRSATSRWVTHDRGEAGSAGPRG